MNSYHFRQGRYSHLPFFFIYMREHIGEDVRMKQILISSPVSSRAWILPYYLEHIKRIDYPKNSIHFYFIINNCEDDSRQILNDFKRENIDEYGSITIETHNTKYKFKDERSTSVRTEFTYHHLSELRNKCLDFAKSIKVDCLLSVDSDILVPSDILTKLLAANKPIISSLIYNGYKFTPETPWKYTNIMKIDSSGNIAHISNWYTKNALKLTESKIVPVDITGAVYLIAKEVIQSGVRYGFHNQGEDVTFSLDAKSKGFNSFCDVSCLSSHIMGEDLLYKHLEQNNIIYKFQGELIDG